MGSEQTFDPASFKSLEYAGWQKAAASYGDLFGSVTRHATEALLDATSVGAGSDVLEVCCGVGYGAGAAQSRGTRAVGVDFAPATVEAAKEYHPAALFMQGDAEALDFDTGSFDAVICAFGINHLQHPEKAISEAFRVLRPGSRYAFTMWCVPGKSKFHQLVLDAIRTHGTLDVPLPDAPPPFHFSQPETCIAALLGASFINPRVIEVPLAYRPNAPEQVLKLTYSAVRLEMILSFQTAEAKERIHREILAGVDGFRSGGTIEIPMPAVLASATKPSPPAWKTRARRMRCGRYLRPPMPADASAAAQADAHVCLLDALGIRRAGVLGGSAGAARRDYKAVVRHGDAIESDDSHNRIRLYIARYCATP